MTKDKVNKANIDDNSTVNTNIDCPDKPSPDKPSPDKPSSDKTSSDKPSPYKPTFSDFGLPKTAFKPIKQRGKKRLKLIVLVLCTALIIGAGAAYWFFFYLPKHTNQAYIQNTAKTPSIPEETTTKEFITETEKEKESSEAPQAGLCKEFPGSLEYVNSKQLKYYVIAGSFVDEDLAKDYAKKLVDQGLQVTLISPQQGKLFTRVAVACSDSFEALDQQQQAHPGSWILYY